MSIRIVRAVLYFKTPTGGLSKHVNWSHYEAKALLTPSTSSRDAFNKFLRRGPAIILASQRELRWLKTIWFYEETKEASGPPKRRKPTETIKVRENMELEILNQ